MEQDLRTSLELKLNKRRRRQGWKKIVSVLGGAVVFCTTYALILPAITMTEPTYCGIEEHIHDESCYAAELICESSQSEVEQHVHSDECYQVDHKLMCELEEIEGHIHSELCLGMEQVLICTQEETEATSYIEESYVEQEVYICGEEETEHVHSETCLGVEQVLVETLVETEGHSHTEECYAEQETYICGEEETGHIHGVDCWIEESTLICGVIVEEEEEIHEHNDTCYEKHLSCEKGEHTHILSCFSNPSADVETASIWESTLPPELTGVWADDLLAVAESQLGYEESIHNYSVTETGEMKGYTRYGDWYGDRYGHWCAMYVSFCLHYAGIPEEVIPQEANCQKWIEALSSEEYGLYFSSDDEEYIAFPGDLVFFNNDADENADHIGIVVEVSEEENYIKTIEGNASERVRYMEYELTDESIMGYGMLPMNPEEFGEAVNLASYSTDLKSYMTAVSMENMTYSNQALNYDIKIDFSIASQVLTSQKKFTYNLPSGFSLAIDKNDVNKETFTVKDQNNNILFTYKYVSTTSVEITFQTTASVENSITIEAIMEKDLVGQNIAFSDTISIQPKLEGKLGTTTIVYNDMKNAFSENPIYAEYYNEDSPLGIAGSFHVVAFDTLNISSHMNGNALAHTMSTTSNFGTNNYPHELSYIVNYLGSNGQLASNDSHILVLGSNHSLAIQNDRLAVVTGSSLTEITKPQNIVIDADSVNKPFINLAQVETEINGISDRLKAVNANTQVDKTSDTQAAIVRLTNPDDILYCDMLPSEFSGLPQQTLRLMGFETGHDGAIVINVNCAGYTEITMPKAYVFVDGNQQSTNEVVVFNAGKVIWNLYNAEGVTINTTEMTGMVIAPGATVTINSNLNGTVVAENINVKAESHRTDFTGDVDKPQDTDLYPFLALFKVDKENVSIFLTDAVFQIEKWNPTSNAYEVIYDHVTLDAQGGMLILDKNPDGTPKELEFNTAYRISEVEAPNGYKLSEEKREFYVPHENTQKYPIRKPSYEISQHNSGHIIYFRNEKLKEIFTSLDIEKSWYEKNGDVGQPGAETITFDIYRDVYLVNPNIQKAAHSSYSAATAGVDNTAPIRTELYQGSVTIGKPDWTLTMRNVPVTGTEEVNGTETKYYYVYYVVENEVPDYEASYKVEDGVLVIENTSTYEETYVLPDTGGIGTNVFTISGSAIIVACLLTECLSKMHERRKTYPFRGE